MTFSKKKLFKPLPGKSGLQSTTTTSKSFPETFAAFSIFIIKEELDNKNKKKHCFYKSYDRIVPKHKKKPNHNKSLFKAKLFDT